MRVRVSSAAELTWASNGEPVIERGVARSLDGYPDDIAAPLAHSDDDVVPLTRDEIITLERLSYSTGLNPDNRIILRVERGFPAKNHICYRKCFQEIRSTG